MSDTDEIARLRALWCEEKSKAMTFHAEIERLRAEVAALKAERHEARREVCWKEKVYNREHGYEPTDERLIAAERGWDCFDAKEVQP